MPRQRHTAPRLRQARPAAHPLVLGPRPLFPQKAAQSSDRSTRRHLPQRSREQGPPPAAGHIHPRSDTRPRPAPPALPARGLRGGRQARPVRPRAGAATCAPGPAPCLRKRGSEPEAGPGPRAPQPPASPVALPLTRRPRDQRRRRRQHEEEQPGTRSSGLRLHGPATTACGPVRPGRRLALTSLASPHLPPPRRPRSGPL